MIYRCSLSTDIFLVLLISTTCVKTKEIDPSVLRQSSPTDENTSTNNQRFDEKSSTTLNGTFNESTSINESQLLNNNNNKTNNGNISNSYIYRISIVNPIDNENHIHINRPLIKTSSRNVAVSAVADSLNINNGNDNDNDNDNDNIFKLDPLNRRDYFNVSGSHNTSQSYGQAEITSTLSPQTPTKSKANKAGHDHDTTDSKTIQLGISAFRNGKDSIIRSALRTAARQGLDAMIELYDKKEPSLRDKGLILPYNHPGAKLSEFSSPMTDDFENSTRAAYAAIFTAKKLKNSLNIDFSERSRQSPPKISLRRTSLEAFCPPRDQPFCSSLTQRYRTHDGTCNNPRKGRWGAAQMPFNRFQSPAYSDGIEELRQSVSGGPLPSPRFISLLVHGSRDSESPVTLMLAQWGQFIDHDLTATAQPKSINGSVPQCCGVSELHPSCAPIKVPTDDPWLAPLGIRCLEFLRSAPAQRRDCLLSWREQTNQVTSYLDASTIYSSNERNSERSRLFTNGLLLFGRGSPKVDVCLRGAFSNQCIRAGDLRSGEQPGLLAMHHAWVLEHNRIAIELADMNLHWSDEKIYQETRRIVGAMVQHITYREFLPLVLGREVCTLFDLELKNSGYYTKYDSRINPTIANSFSAAAFRFGHSLIQSTYMRSTRNHEFLDNNVTLHEENSLGDIGSVGSLHRLLRGLSLQRAQKRDEFISAELTNHLFQSGSFPFGLDLAAINIQRGRDHGLPAYTQWREPCGLTPILDWSDLERVIGPNSARRLRNAYKSIDDIDLFVGGLAERPVVGGLVGPVFACIIAQQFSNLRRGDRFWYENGDFESSFTPAQLQTIRQVNLAQVICRTLGGGTLQPHIFLPHTVATNEHTQCGSGGLAPIDLRPWLERDPFLKNVHKSNESKINISNDNRKSTETPPSPPSALSTNQNEKIFIKLDFPPTSNSIDIRNDDEPLSVNWTMINNKLDLDLNQKPFDFASNTVTRIKTNAATTLRPMTTISRLTSKKKHKQFRSTTHRPTTKLTNAKLITLTTTQRSKQMKKRSTKHSNRQKHKRDVTNDPNDKARSAIYIQFDKQTDAPKSPFSGYGNKKRSDKDKINKMPDKEYIILTPDPNVYDIEIKIKPKPPNPNEKIIIQTNLNETPEDNTQYHYYQNAVGIATATAVTTKRPKLFYNIAQPSIISTSNYGIQSDIRPQQKPTITQITNRPYNGLITKQTTTLRYPYNVHQNDEQTTTKPYFTTKKPFTGYGSNDHVQNDDKPFYAYPSVQNADTSSYYFANNDASQYDDSLFSALNRPTYHQMQTNYLNRPSSVRPSSSSSSSSSLSSSSPTQNDHNRPPSNSYANNNDNPNYVQNERPPQNDLPDTNYGPIYLDDFSTRPPVRLTTAYSVHADPNDDFSDSQPIQNGYGSVTTKRPQNIATFYTVMTIKKQKPTRPISHYYQPQLDNSDDDDDDDDNDEDDDDVDNSPSIFNPSGVISNIVNTFSDYFNTRTTTRKPYIQYDDDVDDFYTYPSIPSHNFPYSRHNNRVDSSERTLNRVARMTNTDMDYEQSTFPSALNSHNNEDVTDDIHSDGGHETITFDHDGYLRPEYMHFNGDTKFEFDVNTQTTQNQQRQTFKNKQQQTRHDKQMITTLTTDNRNTGQSIRVAVPSADRLIGLVPINVLTKPERPDNWVMFNASQKLSLPPRLPPLRSDFEKNSNEMPRPINP